MTAVLGSNALLLWVEHRRGYALAYYEETFRSYLFQEPGSSNVERQKKELRDLTWAYDKEEA